ncbi:hypothetical protein PF003_g37187 [Phytophthora fragariae]|nr:hypothetical protein PF003_g37187 [Phytophthora fragariae]
MKRYLNNPQATREVPTADGFVRTGDVGYIDQDGYIFIVDRINELIKYKGHQVAPAELEDVVNSHPQVAESATPTRAACADSTGPRGTKSPKLSWCSKSTGSGR